MPLFRQIASVLKAEGYSFTVFTPGGSVRLMSDRSAEDYIELTLDTSGDEPLVIGHTSRARGRRVDRIGDAARPGGPVGDITEEDVLGFPDEGAGAVRRALAARRFQRSSVRWSPLARLRSRLQDVRIEIASSSDRWRCWLPASTRRS